MKFYNKVDDKSVQLAIDNLSGEIIQLQKKIGGSIIRGDESENDIVENMKRSHVLMMDIVNRLETISCDLEELKKPWYHRLWCSSSRDH